MHQNHPIASSTNLRSAAGSRSLAMLAAGALTSCALTGCLTRQVWQPSYEPDPVHAVEVK